MENPGKTRHICKSSLLQDPSTKMENRFVRFNWWCPPVMRKHHTSDQHSEIPEGNRYTYLNSKFPIRNFQPKIKPVRCFRCKELGHHVRQCTSEIKVKSLKKQERDSERLRLFIQRKFCSAFPFSDLDDSELAQMAANFKIAELSDKIVSIKDELEDTVLENYKHRFEK